MKKRFKKALALSTTVMLFAGLLRGFGSMNDVMAVGDSTISLTDTELSNSYQQTSSNRVSVHDPSIVKDKDGTYYIFGSHMAWAKSTDLKNWTSFTNNINTNFTTIFQKEIAWAAMGDTVYNASGNMWAPDVVYNESLGKWCMYMSINGISWNSSIAMLTADTLSGNWTYAGTVVYSGFTNANYNHDFAATDYTLATGETTLASRYIGSARTYNNGATATAQTTWNTGYGAHAIDPCVFYGEDGKLYMSYGSWSGGIYLLELSETTGLRDYAVTYTETANTSDPYMGIKLAGGAGSSGEASYIEYMNGYYYMFISNGGFVANGGYNMRVYRSLTPTGPYTDVSGESPKFTTGNNNTNGTIGTRIMSYYKWSYQQYAQVAQGHNSAYFDKDLNKGFVVYHTRSNDGTEGHSVRVHQLFTTTNGYLVSAPFEYDGETISATGYNKSAIVGKYEMIIQKASVDNTNLEYSKGVEISLNEDGTISGTYTGTWTMENGKANCNIVIGGITYEGVFVEQTMEGTNIKTMAFTAVGTNDVCIWGAKYPSETIGIKFTADTISVPKKAFSDLKLPTEGRYGSAISWQSGNEEIISNTGDVTFPDTDTTVSLKMTITNGNYKYEKTYNVIVSKQFNYSDMQILDSYFKDAPQNLTSKTDGSLYVSNPYKTTENIDIMKGAKVKFDVSSPTGVVNALGTIISFLGNDGVSGRLYFTPGSYLGYNATGGFFDANMANWTYVTNHIATGGTVELIFTATGFEFRLNGTKIYDQTICVSPTGGKDITNYYNVLTWLNKTADKVSFGKGSWWADAANVNISNVEFYGYILEPETASDNVYSQTYNFAESASEFWTSTNNQGGLSITDIGDTHRRYLKHINTSSGGRGAVFNFTGNTNLKGEYTVETDINITAGSVTGSEFVIAGDDLVYNTYIDSKNKPNTTMNNGALSGYILKLAAATDSYVYTINDNAGTTVTIPKGTWAHIKADVNTVTKKAQLTITNEVTKQELYSGEISINGTGKLKGLYMLAGRGNSVILNDNVKISLPEDKLYVDTFMYTHTYDKLVSGDFDVEYTFTNTTKGTSAWENFIFEIFDNKGQAITLRADAYGWWTGNWEVGGSALTGWTGTGSVNWTEFYKDMNGSTVNVHAVRNNKTITVTYTITGTNGNNYVFSKVLTTSASIEKDLYIHLSGENVVLTNIAYKVNPIVVETEPETESSAETTTTASSETTTAVETTTVATTTAATTTAATTTVATTTAATTTAAQTTEVVTTKVPETTETQTTKKVEPVTVAVKEVVKADNVEKEAVNQIKKSDVKNVEVVIDGSSKLSEDVFKEVKDSKKNLTVAVVNANNELMYSWSFAGNKITDTNKKIDLAISFDTAKSEEIKTKAGIDNALFVDFAHHGELPGPATIKMYVGDKYADGEKIYLYYYDETAKEVLKVGNKELLVKNGYVEYTITHCSVYFVSKTVLNVKTDSASLTDASVNVLSAQNLVIADDNKTGDSFSFVPFVIIAVPAVASFTYLYLKKRRMVNC